MEAMLEEQSHAIASLRADKDTPPLPTLPPPVSQALHKPLQPPSGFNQRKLLMDEMDAREGRDDQLIGTISSRFGSYLRYWCSVLASSQQDHTPT